MSDTEGASEFEYGNEGYEAPAHRAVQELAELDNADESLKRWKASLGITAEALEERDENRPNVEVQGIALVLTTGGEQQLDGVVDVIEGAEYKLRVRFRYFTYLV